MTKTSHSLIFSHRLKKIAKSMKNKHFKTRKNKKDKRKRKTQKGSARDDNDLQKDIDALEKIVIEQENEENTQKDSEDGAKKNIFTRNINVNNDNNNDDSINTVVEDNEGVKNETIDNTTSTENKENQNNNWNYENVKEILNMLDSVVDKLNQPFQNYKTSKNIDVLQSNTNTIVDVEDAFTEHKYDNV